MPDIQITQQEYERRIDRIRLCGANRGPHDYIAMEWVMNEEMKMVSMFICRTCFNRVKSSTLFENFPEVKV